MVFASYTLHVHRYSGIRVCPHIDPASAMVQGMVNRDEHECLEACRHAHVQSAATLVHGAINLPQGCVKAVLALTAAAASSQRPTIHKPRTAYSPTRRHNRVWRMIGPGPFAVHACYLTPAHGTPAHCTTPAPPLLPAPIYAVASIQHIRDTWTHLVVIVAYAVFLTTHTGVETMPVVWLKYWLSNGLP